MAVEKSSFWNEHPTLALFTVLGIMGLAWVGGALMISEVTKVGIGR